MTFVYSYIDFENDCENTEISCSLSTVFRYGQQEDRHESQIQHSAPARDFRISASVMPAGFQSSASRHARIPLCHSRIPLCHSRRL